MVIHQELFVIHQEFLVIHQELFVIHQELPLRKLPITVMIIAYKDTEIQHKVILKVLNWTTISSQNKVIDLYLD